MANYLSLQMQSEFDNWFQKVAENSEGSLSYEFIDGNYVLHILNTVRNLQIFPKMYGDTNDFTCKIRMTPKDKLKYKINTIQVINPNDPGSYVDIELYINSLKLNTIEFRNENKNPDVYGMIQNSYLTYPFISGSGGDFSISSLSTNAVNGLSLTYVTKVESDDFPTYPTWSFNYVDIVFENLYSSSPYFEIFQQRDISLNVIQNDIIFPTTTILPNAQNMYTLLFDFISSNECFIKSEGITALDFPAYRQNIIDTNPNYTSYQTKGFIFEIDLNSNLEFSNETKTLYIKPAFNMMTMEYLGFYFGYYNYLSQTCVGTGGFISNQVQYDITINAFGNINEYSQMTMKNSLTSIGAISFTNQSYQSIKTTLDIKYLPMQRQLSCLINFYKNNLQSKIKYANIKIYQWITNKFWAMDTYGITKENFLIDYEFNHNTIYKIEYKIFDNYDLEFDGIKIFKIMKDPNFLEESISDIFLDSNGSPKLIIYNYSDQNSIIKFVETLQYDSYANLTRSVISKTFKTFNISQISDTTFGSQIDLTWNTITPISNVKLEISYNLGSSWIVIIPDSINSGSYFFIPSQISNACLIRISDVADSLNCAISNKFSIL